MYVFLCFCCFLSWFYTDSVDTFSIVDIRDMSYQSVFFLLSQ